MIPTFVFGWPSGQEMGDYLALDLGESGLFVFRSSLTICVITGLCNTG